MMNIKPFMILEDWGGHSSFSLKSDSFSVYGNKVNDQNWYQFSLIFNGMIYENIGGEKLSYFVRSLWSTLKNTEGKKINKDSQFFEQIGEESHYLGYIVFSGYTTLLFFKRIDGVFIVLLINGHGNHLNTATIHFESVQLWCELLEDYSSELNLSLSVKPRY